MNTKLSVVIALVAGLAGGMVTRYIAPTPVFAQAPNAQTAAPSTAANELRARSLTLVDQKDRPVGTFATELANGYMRIVLRDASGNQIWSAGGSALRPLSTTVR